MDRIYLQDGSYLYYQKGRFDNWCVYEVVDNHSKKAPEDVEYFKALSDYAKIFKKEKLYADFVSIYNLTTDKLEENVVEHIKNISYQYGTFQEGIFKIFATLYMTMISEEHKKNTKLGKRIKRLGIYYLLVKDKSPEYCANFMTGKDWREIDFLCKEGGF